MRERQDIVTSNSDSTVNFRVPTKPEIQPGAYIHEYQ